MYCRQNGNFWEISGCLLQMFNVDKANGYKKCSKYIDANFFYCCWYFLIKADDIVLDGAQKYKLMNYQQIRIKDTTHV